MMSKHVSMLHPCFWCLSYGPDASLFSKGHLWSFCMELNQAAVSQRKVMLMVAAEERGTTAAGGALHDFSLQTALLRSSWQIEGDGNRGGEITENKNKLLDQRLSRAAKYTVIHTC